MRDPVRLRIACQDSHIEFAIINRPHIAHFPCDGHAETFNIDERPLRDSLTGADSNGF